MKRIVFIALSLVLLTTFISMGCGNRVNQTAILTITESDWVDYELPPEEEPPPPIVTTQEVTRGDEIWLEFGGRQVGPATIREVNEGHVIVRFTTDGIEPNDEYGRRILMTERTWTATIKYGEIYRVSTSTASSGRSWSFRFEKQDDLAEEVGFNWDNTVRVLNEAIGRTEIDAMIVAEVLDSAGVRGVIKAELPEREPGKALLMEVESEDNKLYVISLSLPDSSNRVASVHNIKDVETEELIYARIR